MLRKAITKFEKNEREGSVRQKGQKNKTPPKRGFITLCCFLKNQTTP